MIILKIFRAYFQIKARQARTLARSNLAYYPEGTYGHDAAKLLFAWGNAMRELANSFRKVVK